MSPETTADIARRVLALDAEATPEPWWPTGRWFERGERNRRFYSGEIIAAGNEFVAMPQHWEHQRGPFDSRWLDETLHPNTALIAAYRSDAPALARAYLAEAANAALLAEGAALLLARVESTEADNAALMEIAAPAVSATANDEWRDRWMARLETEHPGDALLRELAVLRLLADAARRWDADLSEYCDGEPRDALRAAFAALEAQP